MKPSLIITHQEFSGHGSHSSGRPTPVHLVYEQFPKVAIHGGSRCPWVPLSHPRPPRPLDGTINTTQLQVTPGVSITYITITLYKHCVKSLFQYVYSIYIYNYITIGKSRAFHLCLLWPRLRVKRFAGDDRTHGGACYVLLFRLATMPTGEDDLSMRWMDRKGGLELCAVVQ